MKLAVLGATSQIATDFIRSALSDGCHELSLFSRNTLKVASLLPDCNRRQVRHNEDYHSFSQHGGFDAVLNFVGVGDPAKAIKMGSEIFDTTEKYDQLALDYIKRFPNCRYIFLSSGVIYGNEFTEPVDENTKVHLDINHLKSFGWYGLSKLTAELKHRMTVDLPIVDIRVFSYFSATQDLGSRFLLSDAVKAILSNSPMVTNGVNIVRDYITPSDFYALVKAMLESPPANDVVDVYSKDAIDKFTLLSELNRSYGLSYQLSEENRAGVDATGHKPNYYSINHRASRYGFQPRYSSLAGIFKELEILFSTECDFVRK